MKREFAVSFCLDFQQLLVDNEGLYDVIEGKLREVIKADCMYRVVFDTEKDIRQMKIGRNPNDLWILLSYDLGPELPPEEQREGETGQRECPVCGGGMFLHYSRWTCYDFQNCPSRSGAERGTT